MENLILVRNQSARSIRTVLGYINNENFQEQPLHEIKGYLRHIKVQWKNVAAKNAKLIEQAPSKREKTKQWKLYDEIEIDYLSASAALSNRIRELKIAENEIFNKEAVEQVENNTSEMGSEHSLIAIENQESMQRNNARQERAENPVGQPVM